MDLDFKDRTFSFLKLKKKKLRRRIFFLSFTLLFLTIFLFYRDQSALKSIRKAESIFMSGDFEACSEFLNKEESPFFRRSSFIELKGVLNLVMNNREKGLDILKKVTPGRTSVRSEKLLTWLSDNCLYNPLDIYSSYLPDEIDAVSFFRIVSDTSLYRADESDKKIRDFSPDNPEKYSKYIAILKEINRKIKSGKIDFIFDRDGDPLAFFDLKSEECISLVPGIDFSEFDPELKKGLKYTKLSVDKDVQLKIHRIFRGYSGSFILTDLEDGSIIASYSKPFSGREDNSALTEMYEPGSVIKLITLFAYLNSEGEKIFPFECKGYTTYEGKIFYDWIRHGTLDNPETALARSCNIAFAEMGIKSGSKKIEEALSNFMFNSSPARDGKFQFGFGKFISSGGNSRTLANLSIGLEHISITTIHSAILSSILAQNGNIIFPHFIMSNQNIFGLGYYNHSPEYKQIYLNNRYFEDVKTGMRDVTTDIEGTGRRALVDFMDIGLKTGTAGKKAKGFDSVLTGFFPFEKPKYSFAFRLEHGGKAEYKGALFLKRFLTSFYEKEK
ncbi:MAG: penicillin-binding transpeptidase domain-containing protein [Acidobacteriota bacterium]